MGNATVTTGFTPVRPDVSREGRSQRSASRTVESPHAAVPHRSEIADTRAAWVAQTLIELTDTVGSDINLQGLTALLAQHYAELVGDPEVGIVFCDQSGLLQEAHASSERVHVLQSFQIEQQEGPAIECATTGHPVVNLRLEDAEGLWPRVVPLARVMGYRTMHVLPLRLRNQTIGAIQLCATDDRELSATTLELGQAMADSATIGILHERTVRRYEVLSEQLQSALNSRVLIEQAKGVMSERLGVDMNDAFTLLRRFARNHNLTLPSVARAAIDGELTPTELRRALGGAVGRRTLSPSQR